MTTTTTVVTWSDLARTQKRYLERIIAGEQFVIMVAGNPVAIIRPLQENETIQITVAAKT